MLERKVVKAVRMTDTLVSRIERYANERSLTFSAAVIQLVVKSLEREGK